MSLTYYKKGGTYCCARNCGSSTRNIDQSVSFHTFPRDKERCQEWIRRAGRLDLVDRNSEQVYRSYRLCSKHFKKDMFMNFASKSRRLIWNALPTENLVNSEGIVDTSTDIETAPAIHNNSHIGEFNSSDGIYGHRHNQVNILQALESLKEKSKEGWTDAVKEVSFGVFHQFPREYEFLSNILSLPPLKSIHEWIDSMYLASGFQRETFIGLQHRLSVLKDDTRVCSLSIIEIPLKSEIIYCSKGDYIGGLVDYGSFGLMRKAADTALMFVVSGIQKNWAQPIGYFVKDRKSNKMLHLLISEGLTKLTQIGLDVRLLVFSVSKANRLFLQKLGVTTECPFAMLSNRIVLCMFCPYSLRTAVRNMLKRQDICFGDKKCSWQYIEKYFEYRIDTARKFLPQMEDYLSSCSENQIDQCFDDESVGPGIHSMGDCGLIGKDAEQTGEFTSKMHQLLRIFSLQPQKLTKGSIKDSDGLSEMLSESLEWIKSWRINKSTEPLLCKEGWIITLNCLLKLLVSLGKQYSFQQLNCRLNQASFLGIKLSKEESIHGREFVRMYRLYFVNSLLKPISRTKLAKNLSLFFMKFEKFINTSQGMSRELAYFYHHQEDCEKVALPGTNRLAFIAVHIVKKLQLIVTCKNCLSVLIQKSHVVYGPDKRNSVSQERKINSGQKNRTVIGPHKNFLKVLPKFESSFVFAFKNMYHMPRVKVKIHQYMCQTLHSDFLSMNIDCKDVKSILIGLFINISLEVIISKMSISGGKLIVPERL